MPLLLIAPLSCHTKFQSAYANDAHSAVGVFQFLGSIEGQWHCSPSVIIPNFLQCGASCFFIGHHSVVSFIISHFLADVIYNDKYSPQPTPDS
jgi:hypothetical protein